MAMYTSITLHKSKNKALVKVASWSNKDREKNWHLPTTTSLTRLTRGGLADTRHSYTPSSSSRGNWI